MKEIEASFQDMAKTKATDKEDDNKKTAQPLERTFFEQ